MKILSFASGKGGVGKSSIALNLAISLSKYKSVTLIDADLGLSNINIMLGVFPKYNMYHLLLGEKNIEDIISITDIGLKFIGGANGFSALTNLSDKNREDFIKQFEKLNDDILIFDSGAGISKQVTSFLLPSDEIFIITTSEPTAISCAYGLIKAIKNETDEKLNINLIVNRVSSIVEAKKVANKIIKLSKDFMDADVKYFGFIYEDECVRNAILQQKPFIEIYKKSKVSDCVNNIAKQILNIKKEEKGIKFFIDSIFKKNN